VPATIAPKTFQMHHVFHLAHAPLFSGRRIARLIRTLEYPEGLSAKWQHLRHEREPIKFSSLIQRCEYFLLIPHLNEVTCF
jgi:hypothetical protein